MRRAVWMLLLPACSFSSRALDVPTSDARTAADGGAVLVDARVVPDAAAPDAGDCLWDFTPTNFDPCALPASNGDAVEGLATTYDTDTGVATVSNGQMVVPPSAIIAQPGGPELRVLVYRNFLIDAPIRVIGARPLLIVATDTLEIGRDDGLIDVSATAQAANDEACTGGAGHAPAGDSSGASGGGGGGFGARGGRGGVGEGVSGGSDGAVSGDAKLAPLRGGCPGGIGGAAGAAAGGAGGAGGGAVQITARNRIILSGQGRIRAGGGGGGQAEGAAGGGGGGSGGAIFLEAPRISLIPDALSSVRLCANGGSGGEGGGFGASSGGAAGSCSEISGATTPDGSGGGDGGGGGYRLAPAGDPGDGGGSPGAGGGGGGVGRIRIRALEEGPILTGSVVSPAASN